MNNGAKGETRTSTFRYLNLNPARLPDPPLSWIEMADVNGLFELNTCGQLFPTVLDLCAVYSVASAPIKRRDYRDKDGVAQSSSAIGARAPDASPPLLPRY